MKLSERVLEEFGKMVVGDATHFPYRSSYYITRFFARYRYHGIQGMWRWVGLGVIADKLINIGRYLAPQTV